MISCIEVVKLISTIDLKKLSFFMKLKLKFHLLICKYCEAYLRNTTLMAETIDQALKKRELLLESELIIKKDAILKKIKNNL